MRREVLLNIGVLGDGIGALASTLRLASNKHVETRRPRTIPGVGSANAAAIMAFAPDLRIFASCWNFAVRVGLLPRQRSTGGRSHLGGVSKMGQTGIRKQLIA